MDAKSRNFNNRVILFLTSFFQEDILDLSELEENYLQSRLQQSPDEIEKRSREIYETYKLAQV